MKARTDIHRPSAINPEDYSFVALENIKLEEPGACCVLQEERKAFAAHQKATGATYASHEHGGTCHICGAWAEYTAIFHHAATNKYIITGMDCAAKLEMGDPARFRTFRKACLDAKHARAGRAKAEQILKEAGLERAWAISEMSFEEAQEAFCPNKTGLDSRPPEEHWTLSSIIGKLVHYGNISDKQVNYLRVLVERLDSFKERLAKRDAERASAKDCPKGRMVIRGVVVSVKEQENDYGTRTVMTVKSPDGWLVWGTVPSSIGVEKGDEVEFTATVEPSANDSKFGFYKRPTKARNLTDADGEANG